MRPEGHYQKEIDTMNMTNNTDTLLPIVIEGHTFKPNAEGLWSLTEINKVNRPRFPRHSPGSLRNAFQTLPVTADC